MKSMQRARASGERVAKNAWRFGEEVSAAPRGVDPEQPRSWVWRGLVNNLLNPKALLFFSLFLPQFATAPAEEVPLQIAVLGGLLTITVMTVNVGVAWGAGSVRRAFNPSGRFDHVASRVLGLVFVGLALRMVFQEVRAR